MMTTLAMALLAVLTVWDYPERQLKHEQLRAQFLAALRAGATEKMAETCREGVKLLPDDPTWHYNLACSLAYYPKRKEEAFDELEKAIDLGFRRPDEIKVDNDLRRLSKEPRFNELVEYAREIEHKPLLLGPLAVVDATGATGGQVALGAQNLVWDLDVGCFAASLRLAPASAGGNTGDLYMNRDDGHSVLDAKAFPGLTVVKLDSEGHGRGMDLNQPNILFPYPVFGNCSRAMIDPVYWRSLPRMLMTGASVQMKAMQKFYLSNQLWVYPANADVPPVGTNGDVFASITPYWLTTAGASYTDQPYLKAALEASRSFEPEVKAAIVRRGLLAPTVMTLIRKNLKGVAGEADYLSAKAHPTAMPGGGVDVQRLALAARKLKASEIPPLATVAVAQTPPKGKVTFPELTYASAFAWAFVLRADDAERVFFLRSQGAEEYAFVQTHGTGVKVKIEKLPAGDAAKVTLDRRGLNPSNRVDIAVFGRNRGTGWGAPSYVSFARMDAKAPYSDPILTPRE